jgi:hypothetical protein
MGTTSGHATRACAAFPAAEIAAVQWRTPAASGEAVQRIPCSTSAIEQSSHTHKAAVQTASTSLVKSVVGGADRAHQIGTKPLARTIFEIIVERRAERSQHRAHARRLIAMRLARQVADPFHRTPSIVGRGVRPVREHVVGAHRSS